VAAKRLISPLRHRGHRVNSILEDSPYDAAFKQRYIEVDEQSNPLAAEAEIGQQLSLVNGQYLAAVRNTSLRQFVAETFFVG
jgi:hypothetical protein